MRCPRRSEAQGDDCGRRRGSEQDRLIVRQKPDSTSITLDGNTNGNRIDQAVFDTTGTAVRPTSHLVDTNNLTGYAQGLGEGKTASSATTAKVYSYGASVLIDAQSVSGSSAQTPRFALTDCGGPVHGPADETEAITDCHDYDAFGKLKATLGTTDNAGACKTRSTTRMRAPTIYAQGAWIRTAVGSGKSKRKCDCSSYGERSLVGCPHRSGTARQHYATANYYLANILRYSEKA